MTRDERKSLADQLHAIQGALDALLDQVINVNEPQPQVPAKKKSKKAK